MGLFSGISKALSRVDDAVVRPVTRVVAPVSNIPAVRNAVDGVGDRLFGDQGSGNRTKAAVAAGVAVGGAAALGAFSAAPAVGVAGSTAVAPGLAAATGQTAAQVAAVASSATSAAVPGALAAATTGSGLAAAGGGLSSIMSGLGSVASGVKDAATTAALIKTLAGGGSTPQLDPLPSSLGLPSVDFSGPAMQLDPPMNWGAANPAGLIRSASYGNDQAAGISPMLLLAGAALVAVLLLVKR
jgi:hypothetical protein